MQRTVYESFSLTPIFGFPRSFRSSKARVGAHFPGSRSFWSSKALVGARFRASLFVSVIKSSRWCPFSGLPRSFRSSKALVGAHFRGSRSFWSSKALVGAHFRVSSSVSVIKSSRWCPTSGFPVHFGHQKPSLVPVFGASRSFRSSKSLVGDRIRGFRETKKSKRKIRSL